MPQSSATYTINIELSPIYTFIRLLLLRQGKVQQNDFLSLYSRATSLVKSSIDMCSRGLRYRLFYSLLFSFRKFRNSIRPGILCVDSSLFTNSILYFQTYCAIGSRNSLVSKAGPDVAMKALVIVLTTLAYSLLRISIVFYIYPSLISFTINYTEHLYIIYSTTTAQ